jgi:raffinose/stachyose/melibiose transport system permease protein
VTAVLFQYLINGVGPLAWLLGKMGKEMPLFLFDSSYALWTIVFYTVFFGIGSNLVLFSGAMSNIDKSVAEAARVDGAGLFREIVHVVIPLTWPTLSTVLVFNFIGLFGASGPILLFTKGEVRTYTISYWIYDRVTFNQQLNYPAAVGLFFTFVGAPIALFMRWLLSKGVEDVTL